MLLVLHEAALCCRSGRPQINASNWQEAARRYLSAAATAYLLAMGEGAVGAKSAASGAFVLQLPGQLAALEPAGA